MGITEAFSKFVVEFLQAFKNSPGNSVPHRDHLDQNHQQNMLKLDKRMIRALVTVFGMERNGRIKKENARQVVEKLGLIYGSDHNENKAFQDDDEEEVVVEEVLGELEDMSKRSELLLEAFKIFDEDGDGYIDAMELKRVLDCLGLDKGWDMNTIERMVKVVVLSLCGKVDSGEFELMMG
ncbi:EF hand calcium-binding family protein [Medicago truncatula]|uniref:EF hand calcium-binding family protein n=1 Tax=Medicago truncatula TaxID=3880 RepID=A0A072V1U9_MEDTR|nr:EF hand calcium-binding family protein [Medicago truncatula]